MDDQVDVREESGLIVIAPVRSHEYGVAQLLDGITPENLQGEVDFGSPVGQESW